LQINFLIFFEINYTFSAKEVVVISIFPLFL